MGKPCLHIIHPPESRLPGINKWLAEAEQTLRSDLKWNKWEFRRIEYDKIGYFNIPTVSDSILRLPGIVILIQKVQAQARNGLENLICRSNVFLYVPVTCPEDIWNACEEAYESYQDGEPRIPLREVIAYLIIRKLERMGCWGGNNQKAFLWVEDLPKGGFPKDIINPREVKDVAEQLVRDGVLDSKISLGARKYALGEATTINKILQTKSFACVPNLHKFFERDGKRVPARTLDYNT